MDWQPIIIPIEIRPGHFVQIMGIPHDLTKEEAAKIARVVEAMAPPSPTIRTARNETRKLA